MDINEWDQMSCSECYGSDEIYLNELYVMDKIIDNTKTSDFYETLYLELMENIDNVLVHPILGNDYYNLGCDHRSCNEFLIHDLRYEFNKIKMSRNIWKWSYIILSIGILIYFIYR